MKAWQMSGSQRLGEGPQELILGILAMFTGCQNKRIKVMQKGKALKPICNLRYLP